MEKGIPCQLHAKQHRCYSNICSIAAAFGDSFSGDPSPKLLYDYWNLVNRAKSDIWSRWEKK